MFLAGLIYLQVKEGFGKNKDPSKVSQELVAAARVAGSGDDITAVVVKLE